MSVKIYWGDLHNHCGISYGHGTLERALKLARQQLDFVSITGHAFWPDIPTDRERYGSVIDYHLEGFAKLHAHWDEVLATVARAEEVAKFIAFPGYEWHSRAYGDHNIIYQGTEGPLVGGESLNDLRQGLEKTGKSFILEPHHIGYKRGGRGVNWDAFNPSHSPIAELYSIHGCSESDEAPFPMLGTMGPRDHESTAISGLEKGHRFGFVASTDQHSGYPGSYGDGRLAVFAEGLTREHIWNALFKRRTYAVTGDKIEADYRVNGELMGGETTGSARVLNIRAVGSDWWKNVEVIKNGRLIQRWAPLPVYRPSNVGKSVKIKVRIEWGWFRPSPSIDWDATVSIGDGEILGVETCFRGDPVVRRDEVKSIKDIIPNELLDITKKSISWKSVTEGNLSTRHSKTQALILSLDIPLNASFCLKVNSKQWEYPVKDLFEGDRAHFILDFPSPAIKIHRAVCEDDYIFQAELNDNRPEREVDYYYIRMEQMNGQCAWLTPVWVNV